MKIYKEGTEVVYQQVSVKLPRDVLVAEHNDPILTEDVEMEIFISTEKIYVVNIYSASLCANLSNQAGTWIESHGYPTFTLPKGSIVYLSNTPIVTTQDHLLQVFYNCSVYEISKDKQKGEGYLLINDHSDTSPEIGFWDMNISLYKDQIQERKNLLNTLSM